MVAPFIGQKIGEDQKRKQKNVFAGKTSWFSVRKYVVTKKEKKKKSLPALPISGFRSQKKKKTNGVIPKW